MFILSMSLISKAFAPDSIFGRDSLDDIDAGGRPHRGYNRGRQQHDGRDDDGQGTGHFQVSEIGAR
jgi:hypothetical protein